MPSKYINLDRLIEKKFDPKKLDRSFYEYLSQRLAEWTAPFIDTHICVVTGFFGPCPGSLLDTVGRGYTDLTAALIAVGLKASELQIWKEVDGVFTADPRKVSSARKLHSISPEEAAELTYYGSEIIHPFTMEQVIRASIPIRIKNTFNPSGDGTLIVPNRMLSTSLTSLKRPTAITLKDNVILLSITSNRRTNPHKFFAQIFSILDKHGIFIDLASTSKTHISIALATNLKDSELEPIISDISFYGKVSIRLSSLISQVSILRDQAILSLVGKEMKDMVGVSSEMFTSLAHQGVNIEMISQGASEINLFCVVHKSKGLKALNCIHNDMIELNC